MAWREQPQLVQRFQAVTECLPDTKPHWNLGRSYDSWGTAQKREQDRLLPPIIDRLPRLTTELLQPSSQQGNAFAVDGSKASVPRTLKNQTERGDVGKPNGIPQMQITAWMQLSTGLFWDFRVGPGTDSERSHLREMLDSLPANSLLVSDAGFVGSDLCQELTQRQQAFLFRVAGHVPQIQQLGETWALAADTVCLWPTDKQSQPPLVLRLIPLEPAGKAPVFLVTNVLDSVTLNEQEASELYRRRWEIEVEFRTLKQTLSHHRLLSRIPANCELEMRWALLGVWVLELMTKT